MNMALMFQDMTAHLFLHGLLKDIVQICALYHEFLYAYNFTHFIIFTYMCVCMYVCMYVCAVSYTHLTLPTSDGV